MATKTITPGDTANLQTALGGAPSTGDVYYINEGAEDYTTVPDWSGTSVASVTIGPGFAGSIGPSWGLQISGVFDNRSSGNRPIYISAVAATINEVRHDPAQGATMYVQSASGGAVTIIRSWGPMVVSAETVNNIHVMAGECLVQAGAEITGEIVVHPGGRMTLERDYEDADVAGLLILNAASITPKNTTTVRSGGTLVLRKSGTWTLTTGTLVLLPGSTLDLTRIDKPVVFENLTDHGGSRILTRMGQTYFSVNGTRSQPGGGAEVVYA